MRVAYFRKAEAPSGAQRLGAKTAREAKRGGSKRDEYEERERGKLIFLAMGKQGAMVRIINLVSP